MNNILIEIRPTGASSTQINVKKCISLETNPPLQFWEIPICNSFINVRLSFDTRPTLADSMANFNFCVNKVNPRWSYHTG